MKAILGYEDRYAITEDGRVFSYPTKRRRWGKYLKQKVSNRGYALVGLVDADGSRSHLGVHRLLAMAYIPNPLQKPTVNHLDGNKLNNSVNNLGWSTQQENVHHARDVLGAYIGKRNGRYKDGRRMKQPALQELRKVTTT